MRRSRIFIAGIGLAALAAVGGVTAAAATGSPAGSAPPASSAPPARSAPATGPGAAAATVRATLATVDGRTEAILVNAQGRPLYYYRADTATRSVVSGGLARLWPPLTSTAPTAAGVSGKVTLVRDSHGHQVAYNGHLLYTFTSDRSGQATGQGFQNFFVATPGIAPLTNSSASPGTVPAVPSGGYGY